MVLHWHVVKQKKTDVSGMRSVYWKTEIFWCKLCDGDVGGVQLFLFTSVIQTFVFLNLTDIPFNFIFDPEVAF